MAFTSSRTTPRQYCGRFVADICTRISILERIPWAQSMVRHMFESLVYQMFTTIPSDTPCEWPFLQMHRDESRGAVSFAIDPSCQCAAPASRGLPIVPRAREVVFQTSLPTSLANHTYHVPAGTNTPSPCGRFDSRAPRNALASAHGNVGEAR